MFRKHLIRLVSIIPALLLCLGIFINNVYAAATYYDKSTAGSDSVNLSSPKSPKTEGNTGTLRYEYNFSLPAGRNGMQPDISLNYSSANESNQNLAGYGWSLNIPNITRINKNGFENMYAENNFTASQYGELLQSTSSNIFLAKKGDLSRAEFVNLTSGWEVKDANGMTYVYGSTPESRVQDETPSRVYSWYLTDITDVFGNNVHYEYIKDDNFVYPHKITYTNYSSNQGIYEIRFNFEGGQSNHNYGKAIDVTVMENGQAYVYPVNSTIANIAKEQGFSWGGDWNKVKDLPHFEMFFDKK